MFGIFKVAYTVLNPTQLTITPFLPNLTNQPHSYILLLPEYLSFYPPIISTYHPYSPHQIIIPNCSCTNLLSVSLFIFSYFHIFIISSFPFDFITSSSSSSCHHHHHHYHHRTWVSFFFLLPFIIILFVGSGLSGWVFLLPSYFLSIYLDYHTILFSTSSLLFGLD